MDATLIPNKAIMGVSGLDLVRGRKVATDAALLARSFAPKVSGQSAAKFYPIWGEGWFGVAWEHPYVWFQEAGTRPHTMRSMAGKVVPMWVNDADGSLLRKNPKLKTRQTADGRKQVLIFRRAAKMGQRKNTWSNIGGVMTKRSVPASYPGAPGRIAVNRSRGIMRSGDVDPGSKNPGWIARSNVGVRWRHPGLDPSRFIARGVYAAAVTNGFPVGAVNYLTASNSTPQATFHIIIQGG